MKLSIVSVERIWDAAAHCAFTDLARFRRQWFCTFREADDHVGSLGRVRVIVSNDGRRWASSVLLAEKGIDLRDPKLSVTPEKKLMLVMGGSAYKKGRFEGRQPRVSFSPDGRRWTIPRRVLEEGDWLWRATWRGSRAYGVSYRLRSVSRWVVALHDTDDGVHFGLTCALRVSGKPNEATIRFDEKGRALMLVRREGGDRQAWIGASRSPYCSWTWKPSGHRMGGPNLIVLPDGQLFAAGRTFPRGGPRVTVGPMSTSRYRPAVELPSGGDCGYPGLAWHGGHLWVSYYSSHEGTTAVYLARLRLD